MRVAGALTIIAGVVFALFLSLWPATASDVEGSEYCGPPIVRAIGDPSPITTTDEACNNESWARSLAAFGVGLAGTVGGVILLAASFRRAATVPAPPAPGWWWDGTTWRPPGPWPQPPSPPWQQPPG